MDFSTLLVFLPFKLYSFVGKELKTLFPNVLKNGEFGKFLSKTTLKTSASPRFSAKVSMFGNLDETRFLVYDVIYQSLLRYRFHAML